MGNDGGSIPTRRELVKEAARNPNSSEVKAAQHEAQTHAWTVCPISNRPLVPPIVSDSAGILYNKDAIIEYLLPSDDPSDTTKAEKEEVLQGRITSLRDIIEIKFQIEKEGKEEKKICPITSKELGPNTKAVYLVPCGHAFSEVAIREVADNICVVCNEPYTDENIIPILPLTKEGIDKLTARAAKLKEAGLTHSLKSAPKSKKRKKDKEGKESKSQTTGLADTEKEKDGSKNKALENGTKSNGASGGIKNAATASLTARVLDEQEQRNKRRKMALNDNLKSLFSSDADKAPQKGNDFMTRGFSIPSKKN
ncbi:Rtf2 RING-finger-domain-containing protein [Xylogone sp. PMI_703]|nr:Rtf2 RING-finger-domain-containing protein [Xylogone sp. PMI_703]